MATGVSCLVNQEEIMQQRMTTNGPEYLVKWKDWDGDPTWEPEANLACPEKLEAFLNKAVQATTQCVEGKPWSSTVTMDIMAVSPQQVLVEVCIQTGRSPGDIVGLYASPPCRTYSAVDSAIRRFELRHGA